MSRIRLLLATGIAAAALAPFIGEAPAFASASPLCEASTSYCVGGPSISSGALLEEVLSSGRNVTLVAVGSGYQGWPTEELKLSNGLCIIAVGDPGAFAQAGSCSGNGSVWADEITPGGDRWINRYISQHAGGKTEVLAGNGDGSDMYVDLQATPGEFQRFHGGG